MRDRAVGAVKNAVMVRTIVSGRVPRQSALCRVVPSHDADAVAYRTAWLRLLVTGSRSDVYAYRQTIARLRARNILLPS